MTTFSNSHSFINTHFSEAAKDGRITRHEASELSQFVDHMQGLSQEEKSTLKQMINKLKDATNSYFLFFSWKKQISPNDKQILERMAQRNQIASKLLEIFNASTSVPSHQSVSTSSSDQFQTPQSSYPQAHFDPIAGEQETGNLFEQPLRTGIHNAQETRAAMSVQDGRVPAWGVGQNGTGLASAGGDCGPASAAMVLKAMGILPENMSSADAIQAVRRAGHAVRTSPPYAMSEAQIYQAIETLSGGRVRNDAHITTDLIRSNSPDAYHKITHAIQQSLAAGNMTMLLTGSPSTNSRHYMIVSHINENGNFVIVDPAGHGGQARVWEMTPTQLQQLMREADARGGSRVMSFTQP